jgi:hypothetical protein
MTRTLTSNRKVVVLGHTIGAKPSNKIQPTSRPTVYAVPGFGQPIVPQALAPAAVRVVERNQPAFAFSASATPAPALKATAGHPPTDEQTAIIAACKRLRSAKGNPSLRILAYAGAGKTSTLKLVAEEGMAGLKGLYIAFNKSIAVEAQATFPASVKARTMHSLAWSGLGLDMGDVENSFNAYSVRDLLGSELASEETSNVKTLTQARLILRVVTLFCQSAAKAITESQIDAALDELVYRLPDKAVEGLEAAETHRLEVIRRTNAKKIATKLAPKLWARLSGWRTLGTKTTFDVYLKVFELSPDLIQQAFRYYDYVMLDEAQDTNPVMASVVAQSKKTTIAVGDSFQQIYAWRGAVDALETLHGEALYLSQSFRFGSAIAESAWRILMAKPSKRPTVKLRGSKKASSVELHDVAVAPVILCRTNAGLLSAAVNAAREGHKVHVVGGLGPVCEEIESAVALFRGRLDEVKSDILKRFPTWKELKAEAETSEDDVLVSLVKSVEGGTAIRDIELLRAHHTDNQAAADTIVSTTHKAKGRQFPIVALHNDYPDQNVLTRRMMAAQISGNREMEKAFLEEYHVMYVAATRAQEVLRVPARYHDWLGHGGCTRC